MFRELKQAGKIHSCCNAKWIVKLRRTMNERPIAINNRAEIVTYPDFFFKKRTRSG